MKILNVALAAGLVLSPGVPPGAQPLDTVTSGWLSCPVNNKIDYQVKVTWYRINGNARPTYVQYRLAGSIGKKPPKITYVHVPYWSAASTTIYTGNAYPPGTYAGTYSLNSSKMLPRPVSARVHLYPACSTGVTASG